MARLTRDEMWAPVLGQFMLSFGWIESSVNHLLSQHYPSEKLAKMYKQPLSQRFELAKTSIAERPISAQAAARVLAHLEEARILSVARNHVAHSPLALAMFDADDDSKRTMREVIVSNDWRDENHIDFAKLQSLTERAKAVAAELSMEWIELGRLMSLGDSESDDEHPHIQP